MSSANIWNTFPKIIFEQWLKLFDINIWNVVWRHKHCICFWLFFFHKSIMHDFFFPIVYLSQTWFVYQIIWIWTIDCVNAMIYKKVTHRWKKNKICNDSTLISCNPSDSCIINVHGILYNKQNVRQTVLSQRRHFVQMKGKATFSPKAILIMGSPEPLQEVFFSKLAHSILECMAFFLFNEGPCLLSRKEYSEIVNINWM